MNLLSSEQERAIASAVFMLGLAAQQCRKNYCKLKRDMNAECPSCFEKVGHKLAQEFGIGRKENKGAVSTPNDVVAWRSRLSLR